MCVTEGVSICVSPRHDEMTASFTTWFNTYLCSCPYIGRCHIDVCVCVRESVCVRACERACVCVREREHVCVRVSPRLYEITTCFTTSFITERCSCLFIRRLHIDVCVCVREREHVCVHVSPRHDEVTT